MTALFGIQALINTAMTVGLLPITGMSLPLVSYGGWRAIPVRD
jgi:cell division protein FtsW (lipid II flippase)